MQTALPGPVTSFNMADYFFQYMCLNNKRTATEMDTVPESNNNKLYLHDHNKVLQYCKSYLKLLIDSL